ncbi:MAG: 30S ribosomal protein S1, partial [Chloroflexota bacterium]
MTVAGETDESRFPLDESGDSMRDLLEASEEHAQSLHVGQIVEGFIVHVEPDEVLVDIGLKSEGVVKGRELGSEEAVAQLRVGQTVLVYVLRAESNEGHPVLSLRRAEAEQHWREAEEHLAAGATLEAPVLECNRGGLIVDLGLRAFVPISQVADLRRDEPRPASPTEGEASEGDATLARLQHMVGQRISVKIIELSRPRNRVIASQRAAVQELRQQRKNALLSDLHVGDVRQGRVSSLAEFGAFVDLGGADGLVHISEVSWTRITHPRDVLHVGQEVDVAVLNVDPDTKKIGLSIKQAQADPWTELVAHL